MSPDPDRTVGSVVEEAARLVEALRMAGVRGASAGMPGAGAPEPPNQPPLDDHDHQPLLEDHDHDHGHDHANDHEHVHRPGAGARPLTCGICPVCRGLEFVGTLPPEALDRFADLARGVAGLISDFAASARARAEDLAETGAGPDAEPDQPPPADRDRS